MKEFLQKSLKDRSELSAKLLQNNSDRVPIILIFEKSRLNLMKNKYLCPIDITFVKFASQVRKQITDLNSQQALFFFIGEKKIMPPPAAIIYELYEKYKAEDNFLYIICTTENCFGS